MLHLSPESKLVAFTQAEQQELFVYYHPQEDFTHFLKEAERFDLPPLLGNPQFLDLFTNAYVQAGRRFKDKKSLFQDAMKRLACAGDGREQA